MFRFIGSKFIWLLALFFVFSLVVFVGGSYLFSDGGSVTSGRGFPAIVHVPGSIVTNDCVAEVTSVQAQAIAESEGLAPGIADWRINCYEYNDADHPLVWTVENTLEQRPTSSQGDTVIIDAHTGAVVTREFWGATQ